MRARRVYTSLLCAFLVFAALPINVGITAEPETIIGFSPVPVNASVGQEFAIDVVVDQVTNLYGFQVDIQFNSGALEIVKIEAPDAFKDPYGLWSGGTVNNATGTVSKMYATRLGNNPGLSGTVKLATITFKVKNVVENNINIVGAKLVDSNVASIATRLGVGVVNPQAPAVSIDSISPDPSAGASAVTANVTVDDATSGGSQIFGCEYFIDTPGEAGDGVMLTPADGQYDEQTETFTFQINTSQLSMGAHTLYVHAADVVGKSYAYSGFATRSFTVSEPCSAQINSITPATGRQGETLSVTVNGDCADFAQGQTTVSLGSGIAISNINVTSPSALTATVEIDGAATTGPRNVVVATGTKTATLTSGFMVEQAQAEEDTTPPHTQATVTPADPDGDNGWYVTAPAIVLAATDDSSGVDYTKYQWGSGTEQTYTDPITAPEGETVLSYYSADTKGNIETAHAYVFNVDLTDPVAPTINSPVNGASVCMDEAIVSGLATSGDTVSVYDSGSEELLASTVALQGEYSVTIDVANGTYSVFAKSTDPAGRTSTSSIVSFTVDCQGPQLFVQPPTNDPTNQTELNVQGTTDGVSVTVNGEAAALSSGSFSKTIDLVEGQNVIEVIAKDQNQNETAATISVRLDTVPPAPPVVSSPVNGAVLADASVTFSGTRETDTAVILKESDTELGREGIGSASWTIMKAMAEGSHAVVAIAEDAAGNQSAPTPVSFEVDVTSPAKVNDLAVIGKTDTSINLSWTAVGDDEQIGQAKDYDLRYSEAPIAIANWDQAKPVISVPAPKSSGSSESLTIANLKKGTNYWFAVKVRDNAGNDSELSNIATDKTTGGIPGLIIAPPKPLVPPLVNMLLPNASLLPPWIMYLY